MYHNYLDLLTIGISGAAFFIAFFEKKLLNELKTELRHTEQRRQYNLSVMRKIRRELSDMREARALEHEVSSHQPSAAEQSFYEGLQNILNYSGDNQEGEREHEADA